MIQAFQAASAGGASGSTNTTTVPGENFPRGSGRGVDERSARAVAEARKKAAARGLLIRPHGVPVPAMPPLTQLLNIINSGMTPENTTAGDDANTNGAVVVETTTPVGLGPGLGALDPKKNKQNATTTATK